MRGEREGREILELKIILLGILQGLTEFFPVSSSGHLGLGELLLGVHLDDDSGATLEIALHFGTLFAVLVFLRRDLMRVILPIVSRGADAAERTRAWRVVLLIGTASLPAAVVGLLFEERIEALFAAPWIIGGGFLVTGVVLVLSRRLVAGTRSAHEASLGDAILIGCAQVIAMVPGISRSGSTIVAAMGLGLRPDEAGRFSFLMAIPVIGGATLLKARDILGASADERLALLLGVIAAFLSGLVALRYLTLMLRRGSLFAFAYYVIPLALVTFYVAGRA